MTGKTYSYPQQKRIRKRKEFLACYEHGRKFHCAHFIVYALAGLGQSRRIGMAVSRKVGNAVARNRVKRVLREFFRLNFADLPALHIVVVAKKNAAMINYNEACGELSSIMPMLVKLPQSPRP